MLPCFASPIPRYLFSSTRLCDVSLLVLFYSSNIRAIILYYYSTLLLSCYSSIPLFSFLSCSLDFFQYYFSIRLLLFFYSSSIHLLLVFYSSSVLLLWPLYSSLILRFFFYDSINLSPILLLLQSSRTIVFLVPHCSNLLVFQTFGLLVSQSCSLLFDCARSSRMCLEILTMCPLFPSCTGPVSHASMFLFLHSSFLFSSTILCLQSGSLLRVYYLSYYSSTGLPSLYSYIPLFFLSCSPQSFKDDSSAILPSIVYSKLSYSSILLLFFYGPSSLRA